LTATTVSTDYCLIIIISIPINIIIIIIIIIIHTTIIPISIGICFGGTIAMAMAPGIIVGGADKIWLKN